jgi:hypothetical protein
LKIVPTDTTSFLAKAGPIVSPDIRLHDEELIKDYGRK